MTIIDRLRLAVSGQCLVGPALAGQFFGALVQRLPLRARLRIQPSSSSWAR
jgi:hypothetical protein